MQEITASVLVVDDHEQARASIADILRHAGHAVTCCASAAEALSRLETIAPDVILTDLQMPGMNGLEFIRAVVQRGCAAQIAMLTAYASVSTAVEAMRSGAFDYIEKPFNADQLEQLVQRALRHGDRVGRRSTMPGAEERGGGGAGEISNIGAGMVGSSAAMRELRARIGQIAATGETVLITGESGTGKELVARAIHAASPRRDRALVSVNCPALSPQLMESELFGHERGAFTSADAPRVGRFELAEGGTILLDEVTEIDLPLQAKLLRVLQERAYERVGSSRTTRADVRVLAATNRDLLAEVERGRFRQDLYYRLAVVPMVVPPLRERREDVPELVRHFSTLAARRMNAAPCELDSGAVDLLQQYDWPGTVRELENVVTRACVLHGGKVVTSSVLSPWLLGANEATFATSRHETDGSGSALKLEDMERQLIEATLERFAGHRERAAKALGIGVRTLANKLRLYGYAPRTKVFAKAA
jgi:DNA-binding NtrC family response regulator